MATNFPTSADDATTVGGDSLPAPGTALSDSTEGHPSHSDLHENVGDAVQAVEAKIGTGSSTPAANTVLTGTGSGTSGWATVSTAMIGDDQVTAAKLASNAVVTASIVDDNVTQAKIADDAVGADQLAASAVVTASIVDDNVTQAKIAAGAVGTTELAADAVDGTKIADDAINSEHIGDDQVTQAKIAPGAVGNDELIDAPTFTGITLGGQDLGEIETFTPSYTNTSGFESNQGYYAYVKDLVYVSIETEFSGGVTVGDTRVDLPVAAADVHQASNAMLQVQLYDFSENKYYQGMATPVDSNTIQVRRVAIEGSNLIGGPTSSTLPFTWADGDKILITGFYRVGS